MRNEIQLEKLGKPLMNKILVEIEDTSSEFTTKGGIIAKSDYDNEAWSDSIGHSVSEFIPRSGKVINTPRLITAYNYDYHTIREVEIGDIVFWNLICFAEMQVISCDGKKYVLCDYHDILIRLRNGVITPINGYVLLRPVSKETTALAYTKVQKVTDYWDIIKMPETIPISQVERRNSPTEWEVGDRVILMVFQSPFRIEGALNKVLEEDLYCAPVWMVLCSIDIDE